MTERETLFTYRLQEAEETLSDAVQMLDGDFSPRSVVNRAYYTMFYAVLALFIRFETVHKTSKHSGIIGIFNKEFVHTGKIEVRLAKMLNNIFETRLEGDYKGLVELTQEDAQDAVEKAREFFAAIKELVASP
jgi:uncharacterized protein (UPF0332 family)